MLDKFLMKDLTRHQDYGILLIRVLIGASFVVMGVGKLMGGPELWAKLGGAMPSFGVAQITLAWGLAAAVAELLGGLLFAIGMFFRPALILALIPTMIVATYVSFSRAPGLDLSKWGYAASMLVIFVGFLLIGPGRHSVDKR